MQDHAGFVLAAMCKEAAWTEAVDATCLTSTVSTKVISNLYRLHAVSVHELDVSFYASVLLHGPSRAKHANLKKECLSDCHGA